tara:strand:+ start:379 stop:1260 length:882 start_codon:yes stop_codon:yes gene_type:complete
MYKFKYGGVEWKVNTSSEVFTLTSKNNVGYLDYELGEIIIDFNSNYDPEKRRKIPKYDKNIGFEMLPYNEPNEKLGIVFEMAICLTLGIEFVGNFKYDINESKKISEKLKLLIDKVPELKNFIYKHVARCQNRYDFTDGEHNLSAKTNKNISDQKVAPQVIGQPSKTKFCNHFNIDINMDDEKIKEYIVNNINNLLSEYFKYTFDCSIIHYNGGKNKIMFIKCKSFVDWNEISVNFTHINNNNKWSEGTTIKIGDISIGEFQFHNNRDNIKFRWCLENLLDCFKDNFEITTSY